MHEQSLHFRRLLQAPQAKVFSLWTEPASIERWFGGFDTHVERVELDLREGGQYRIEFETEEGISEVSGKFLLVEPPSRLSYTWVLNSQQGVLPATTVEVEFRAQGQETLVVLNHGPFPQDEVKALHSQGWQACFAAIQSLISQV
ncbi:MAG: SRPBCC domain-containing protein [Anaerolineales bacterium]